MLAFTIDTVAKQISINHTSSGEGGGLMLGIIIIAALVWISSIVQIASTRTKDPFDRVVWLLVVLALFIVGSILYWIFGKTEPAEVERPLTDEEIKRRANEGTLR